MRQNNLNFSILIRIAVSLIPICFGMGNIAMILCAYNLAMSFIMMGPMQYVVGSLSSVCISMALNGLIFGEAAKLDGLYLALEAVACSISCVLAIIKFKDFYKGVYLSAIGYLIPSAVSLSQMANDAGQSIADYLTKEPFEIVKMQIAQVATQAQINSKIVTDVIDMTQKVIVMVIPTMLVIVSIIIGYIVMWSVSNSLKRTPFNLKHSFSEMKLPKLTVIVMIPSFVLWYININHNTSYIFLNIFLILFAISFFAGLSFIDFYLRKKIHNLVGRILFYFLIYLISTTFIMINPYLNIFVIFVIIAVVDSFVNIRHLKTNEMEDNESETKKAD